MHYELFIVLHGQYNYDNAFSREEERQWLKSGEELQSYIEVKETMLCDE